MARKPTHIYLTGPLTRSRYYVYCRTEKQTQRLHRRLRRKRDRLDAAYGASRHSITYEWAS